MLLLLAFTVHAADFDHHQLGHFYGLSDASSPAVEQASWSVVDFGGATGVVVSADGLVLTNAHVASQAGQAHTASMSRSGALIELELLDIRDDLDVAVYRIDAEQRAWLPIRRTRPVLGEPVAVLGHPGARPLRVSFGTVLTPQATVGGIYSVEYSAQTALGSSGSPVLDTQGQMVALHWGWDSDGRYHGRLTGVPMAHAASEMPIVAAAARCPDPKQSLRIDSRLLAVEGQVRRVRLTLHDLGSCLAHVDEVTWHLHPTFDDPDAPGWAGAEGFPLTLLVWGQFPVSATVRMAEREVDIQGQVAW